MGGALMLRRFGHTDAEVDIRATRSCTWRSQWRTSADSLTNVVGRA